MSVHPAASFVQLIGTAADFRFDLRSITDKAKEITLQIRLSCSEGEWTRTQTVQLQPNESRHLVIFFPEPTIDAKDIKAHVEVIR